MKVNVNLIKGSKVLQKKKRKSREARESRRVTSRAPASVVTAVDAGATTAVGAAVGAPAAATNIAAAAAASQAATDVRLAGVRFGSGSGVLGPNLNLHPGFGSGKW